MSLFADMRDELPYFPVALKLQLDRGHKYFRWVDNRRFYVGPPKLIPAEVIRSVCESDEFSAFSKQMNLYGIKMDDRRARICSHPLLTRDATLADVSRILRKKTHKPTRDTVKPDEDHRADVDENPTRNEQHEDGPLQLIGTHLESYAYHAACHLVAAGMQDSSTGYYLPQGAGALDEGDLAYISDRPTKVMRLQTPEDDAAAASAMPPQPHYPAPARGRGARAGSKRAGNSTAARASGCGPGRRVVEAKALASTPMAYEYAVNGLSQSVEAPAPTPMAYEYAVNGLSQSVEAPAPAPKAYEYAVNGLSKSVEALDLGGDNTLPMCTAVDEPPVPPSFAAPPTHKLAEEALAVSLCGVIPELIPGLGTLEYDDPPVSDSGTASTPLVRAASTASGSTVPASSGSDSGSWGMPPELDGPFIDCPFELGDQALLGAHGFTDADFMAFSMDGLQ